MNCKKCEKSVRNDSIVYCNGQCTGILHLKCAGLSEYDASLIQKNPNLIYLCNDCIEYKQNILKNIENILETVNKSKNCIDHYASELKSILDSVNSIKRSGSNDMLEKINESLKKQNEVTVNLSKSFKKSDSDKSVSFAEVVKKAPSVIVKPKCQQNADKTKNDLQHNIDPAENNLKVKHFKMKRSGVVVIDCENEESVEKFRSVAETALGENYDIHLTKERKPRVRIVGISSEISENTVIEKLRKQNDISPNYQMDLKAFFKGRSKYNPYCAVIEVEPELYNKIMLAERVRLGWNLCRVYEGTYVRRCFKCLGFQHTQSQCKETGNKKCFKCSEEHAEHFKCEVDSAGLKCVNCVRANKELNLDLNTNHNAFDNEKCAVFRRKLKVARDKIF